MQSDWKWFGAWKLLLCPPENLPRNVSLVRNQLSHLPRLSIVFMASSRLLHSTSRKHLYITWTIIFFIKSVLRLTNTPSARRKRSRRQQKKVQKGRCTGKPVCWAKRILRNGKKEQTAYADTHKKNEKHSESSTGTWNSDSKILSACSRFSLWSRDSGSSKANGGISKTVAVSSALLEFRGKAEHIPRDGTEKKNRNDCARTLGVVWLMASRLDGGPKRSGTCTGLRLLPPCFDDAILKSICLALRLQRISRGRGPWHDDW